MSTHSSTLRGKQHFLSFKLNSLTHIALSLLSQTHTSSRDYTGKATANYPNGDSYEGEFVNGVSDDSNDRKREAPCQSCL